MSFKIEVNKETCIGCGACTSICDNFEVVEENGKYIAKPKKSKVDELGTNKDADEICPVKAILISEEK